jgi:putative inorganic carbon (HCO3(-)) transporter
VSVLFVALDTWFILRKQSGLVAVVPLALIVVYFAIFSLDKLMLFVVFCTPLSINLSAIPDVFLEQVGVGAALPTEPIMFGIMLLFILLLVYEGMDKNIFNHPITLIILFGMFWMLVTTITSTEPVISVKYFIERSWGVVTFYFLGIYLFSKKKYIYTFMWMYIVPFTFVILYTTVRHAALHFTEKGSHFSMHPFYNDHTAYGALLAMFIPVVAGLTFNRFRSKFSRIAAGILLAVFIIAVGLSYSRASWVSLVVAIGILVLLLFKIKLRTILIFIIIGIGILFANQTRVIMKLERNNKVVSQDLTSEIQSISNISSDASNRERINRWSCAYRMFLDKPYFGFGPGTYAFKYAPYQIFAQRTIISTNLGTGGNAHSEYLGPLSEQGLLGMLGFMALAIGIFILSFNLYYKLENKEMRIVVVSVFLGLVTYFVHGFMNNFLDTDKAAVPFWGFVGILVAIDLERRGIRLWKEKEATSESGKSAV